MKKVFTVEELYGTLLNDNDNYYQIVFSELN